MFITLVCGVLGSLPGYFENPKQTNTSKYTDSNRGLFQRFCDCQL